MAAGANTNLLLTIALYGGIFGVFYLLWFRPQQLQRKKVREMLAALKPGDEIMTAGGLMGTVRSMDDDLVIVEIADGVRVRFTRRAIIDRVGTTAEPTDE